jgi:inorganic pyrophosphatase
MEERAERKIQPRSSARITNTSCDRSGVIVGGKRDDKLIAVLPGSPLDVAGVNDIDDLEIHFPGIKNVIETWFTSYKGPGEMLSLGFAGYDEARTILDEAAATFK